MPDRHALLSASSSHRWIECPPSARLCAAQEDGASTYAQQGTDAHTLAEFKLRKALGAKAPDPRENLTYLDQEMERCTDEYCQFVLEQLARAGECCEDPRVEVEKTFKYSRWVPGGFGTCDCVIVADGLIHVIDFKYGAGVSVDADRNTQMMCYALGVLNYYEYIYETSDIKMSIVQPRLNNISTCQMTKKELLAWAEDTLRPAADLAYKGLGEFKAGDHCRFCRVRSTCRKRADYNLRLARYEFRTPDALSEAEIADILPRIESLTLWASDVQEYALSQALSGAHYPGYKLVEGKSRRKYTDETAAASAAMAAGFDPYEKKILGITAMTSLMGRDKFNEVLGNYITKPQGKPALVPEDDKRPAMNTAKNDFSE